MADSMLVNTILMVVYVTVLLVGSWILEHNGYCT